MRICIVSAEHSPYGGIGNALRLQAELLSAHHEVTLIERPEPSEALARMSFAGEDHLRSAAVLEAIEAAYAGGEGPDVLEVCDYRALGLVPLQARAARHRLLRKTRVAVRTSATAELVALHDGRSMLPGERRAAELEREQFRLADRLFWPGGDVLDLYRRYYGDELLPLPVRTGRPYPVPAHPPRVESRGGPLRILYAGRLQRLKGVLDLVEACLGLPDDDWELTMIGADTETAAMGQSMRLTIEAMCEGDPRVQIEDPVPHEELQRRFADHDLLVSASTFEVCANVVLEAMGAGLPVLATPVGAQTEAIEPGVSGWLTEGTGTVALRSALTRLLADRAEVERVRTSGEVFAAFSRFTDVAPLLAAYESLGEPAETASPVPVAGAGEPSVTAVLPYFRAHLYIEEAVDSILAQTHRNLDVVIVNDGSFEPEDAVLDRLAADPRVQVVNQLNRGDLTARNLGLSLARGDYLLMFDADNVLEPEFVARALAMFGERPELAYVTCWLRFVDAEGNELDGGGYAPLGNRVLSEEGENWDGDTSALLPRRVLDLLQPPLAADGPMQGDWLLYRRLRALEEYGAVIPERLVRYRVLPQSLLRGLDEELHARAWAEGKDWRKLAAVRWTGQR